MQLICWDKVREAQYKSKNPQNNTINVGGFEIPQNPDLTYSYNGFEVSYKPN